MRQPHPSRGSVERSDPHPRPPRHHHHPRTRTQPLDHYSTTPASPRRLSKARVYTRAVSQARLAKARSMWGQSRSPSSRSQLLALATDPRLRHGQGQRATTIGRVAIQDRAHVAGPRLDETEPTLGRARVDQAQYRSLRCRCGAERAAMGLNGQFEQARGRRGKARRGTAPRAELV